ncbi:MAG: glutamate--tRNA ligase family protein [Myxococcota bacterium]|nr:glutamate--tRNA ligase family protein [Myxococcota bacterium]
MPAAPRTRFAPAPTGFLHLGHVANAVYVWGLAQTLEARVLLRIEDHDRQRCQPRYEQALLEDLDWLGFEADVFPAAQYREGPCAGRQSDRDAAYRAAAAKLAERGLLFGCDCSRRDVAAAAGSELARSPAGELRYAGHCRDRGLALSDGVGWRLRMPPVRNPSPTLCWAARRRCRGSNAAIR